MKYLIIPVQTEHKLGDDYFKDAMETVAKKKDKKNVAGYSRKLDCTGGSAKHTTKISPYSKALNIPLYVYPTGLAYREVRYIDIVCYANFVNTVTEEYARIINS